MVAVRRSSFSMETWNWTVFILLRLVILYPSLISTGTTLCEGRYNSPSFYKSEQPSFEFVTGKRDNFEYNNIIRNNNNNNNNNNNLIPAPSQGFYPAAPSSSSSPIPSLSFDQTEEFKANQARSFNNTVNSNVIQKRFLNKNSHDRYDQDEQFKGWTNIEEEKPEEPVWSTRSPSSSSPSTQPDGKTVDFLPPLPSLNILEDPGYDHGTPMWPLNEYLVDKFHSLYRPFRSNKTEAVEGTKHHHFHHNLYNNHYEWQQLQPSQHFGSTTSGSDNMYNTKFYDEDRYRNRDHYSIYNGNHVPHHNHHQHHHHHRHQSYGGNNEQVRGQESGTNEHSTTVSTATDVKGNSNGGSDGSANRGANRGYGHGYGWGPQYFPPDHYPKKRFRLQIHPGYIAAPLAGLAAFGAASALTKKPLLFELGLVNNKYPYRHYAGQYPQNIHYPGHGWASNIVPVVPPVYPQVNPPILTSGGLVPQIPILKPEASHHHNSHIHSQGHHHHHHLDNHHHNHHNHHHHGHHQAETDKKPWWNPFAALTPRD